MAANISGFTVNKSECDIILHSDHLWKICCSYMIPKSIAIISMPALWFMIIVRHNWYIVETNVVSQTGNAV